MTFRDREDRQQNFSWSKNQWYHDLSEDEQVSKLKSENPLLSPTFPPRGSAQLALDECLEWKQGEQNKQSAVIANISTTPKSRVKSATSYNVAIRARRQSRIMSTSVHFPKPSVSMTQTEFEREHLTLKEEMDRAEEEAQILVQKRDDLERRALELAKVDIATEEIIQEMDAEYTESQTQSVDIPIRNTADTNRMSSHWSSNVTSKTSKEIHLKPQWSESRETVARIRAESKNMNIEPREEDSEDMEREHTVSSLWEHSMKDIPKAQDDDCKIC